MRVRALNGVLWHTKTTPKSRGVVKIKRILSICYLLKKELEMDFSKLHNPFDFANPVMDPKLFAGRKSELDDIEYYLYNAKNAPRAINLALIGDKVLLAES